MTKHRDTGLFLSPIEANHAPLPGAVLYANMHEWIDQGLSTEEILAQVTEITGHDMPERDTMALSGWIRDERLLADGFRLRHGLDQQVVSAQEIDPHRPFDDIAAARVAMTAAGIIQPNQPAQGEQ